MTIDVLMPALSPTMTDGKLARWLKSEGDVIAAGDIIFEIETDKATMEVEAVEDGILAKILIAEGTEGVAVNTPIAVLLEAGEDKDAAEARTAAAPAAPEIMTAAPAAPEIMTAAPAPGPASEAGKAARVIASPVARRLAAEHAIDLAAITASGPRGRVVKSDVEAAITGAPAAPGGGLPALATAPAMPAAIAPGAFAEIPHTTMRRVIAERLTQSSRDIPHFYLSLDCRIDRLMELRGELNQRARDGAGDYKISVNDFVIRAAALALRKVPGANASWGADAIRLYQNIDIAIAVATDGGLITPIIRNADFKGLAEISAEMRGLGARARAGKLAPEEYQGGGFTISNLGMMGVREFSAIINPPQACILAVGAGEKRPHVIDGALGVAMVMTCTLGVDHRAVDGALGAEFMGVFKDLLENPLTMLL